MNGTFVLGLGVFEYVPAMPDKSGNIRVETPTEHILESRGSLEGFESKEGTQLVFWKILNVMHTFARVLSRIAGSQRFPNCWAQIDQKWRLNRFYRNLVNKFEPKFL